MRNKYELFFMSFDGDYVKDSDHATIEAANDAIDNIGSKWVFYPWPVIVKGKTVKAIYGNLVNGFTGESYLNVLLKGKRFKTVCNLFKTFCDDTTEALNSEDFECLLVDKLEDI